MVSVIKKECLTHFKVVLIIIIYYFIFIIIVYVLINCIQRKCIWFISSYLICIQLLIAVLPTCVCKSSLWGKEIIMIVLLVNMSLPNYSELLLVVDCMTTIPDNDTLDSIFLIIYCKILQYK